MTTAEREAGREIRSRLISGLYQSAWTYHRLERTAIGRFGDTPERQAKLDRIVATIDWIEDASDSWWSGQGANHERIVWKNAYFEANGVRE